MSNDPHDIRLRGPWRVRVAGEAKSAGIWSLPGVVPAEIFGGTAQSLEMVRQFSWVAGLAMGERIFLVLPSRLPIAEVHLNGNLIGLEPGGPEPATFDITNIIRPRNELVFRLKLESGEEWKESELPTLRMQTQRGAEE